MATGTEPGTSICKRNKGPTANQLQLMKSMCKDREKVAIGIDLGTSTCTVGVYQDGQVEIIINEGANGPHPPPAVVALTNDGRLVNDAVKSMDEKPAQKNPICDMIKTIGRGYYDKQTRHEMRMVPFRKFKVEGQTAFEALCKKTDRRFMPVEIASMILQKVKEITECLLGKIVLEAVLTVPVYFNEYERQATIEAAKNAGLNVLRLMNEPVAAAVAYGFLHSEGKKNALVFDLGGGTLDVSVFSIGNGVVNLKATSGNMRLGGRDFDDVIVSYFAKEIKSKHGIDVMKHRAALEKLRSVCEQAKRCLSTYTKAIIKIKGLIDEVNFHSSLSRAKFEELNDHLFNRTLPAIEDVLEDANLNKEEIDEIVLVGGSTKIPKIQSLLKEFFPGKELIQSINPEEAVAFGAALEAAVMAKEESEKRLLEVEYAVAPHSLGIKSLGGIMNVIVPKDTPLPCAMSKEFSTSVNCQKCVILQVFEGEKKQALDNNYLATLELKGLIPAPRGDPKIQVTFCVDKSGIIIVTAREEKSGRKNAVMITDHYRKISKLDVEKMIRDTFGKKGKKRRPAPQPQKVLEQYPKC